MLPIDQLTSDVLPVEERVGRIVQPIEGKLEILDLACAMRSPRRLGQQAAFCFREAGVSEVCGKAGNALLYRRAAKR